MKNILLILIFSFIAFFAFSQNNVVKKYRVDLIKPAGKSITINGKECFFNPKNPLRINNKDKVIINKDVEYVEISSSSGAKYRILSATINDFGSFISSHPEMKVKGTDNVFDTTHFSNNFKDRRIALIIGNDTYISGGASTLKDLPNTDIDAFDVSLKLDSLGFDRYTYFNLSKDEMEYAINRFAIYAKSKKYDVAVFYYSGHGIQNNGKHYLAPVNAIFEQNSKEIDSTCVSFDEVFKMMASSECKTKLVFLDACRNQPPWANKNESDQDVTKENANGSLVVFASEPFEYAFAADNERNSPFTKAFLENVSKPFSTVNDAINSISKSMKNASKPYIFGVGDIDFSFFKQKYSKEQCENAALKAKELISEGKLIEAMCLCVEHLPSSTSETILIPYVPEVERELRNAYHAFYSDTVHLVSKIKTSFPVDRLWDWRGRVIFIDNYLIVDKEKIFIIDVNNGKTLHVLGDYYNDIAINSRNELVGVLGSKIDYWDYKKGKLLKTKIIDDYGTAKFKCLSRNGESICVEDGPAYKIFNFEEGKEFTFYYSISNTDCLNNNTICLNYNGDNALIDLNFKDLNLYDIKQDSMIHLCKSDKNRFAFFSECGKNIIMIYDKSSFRIYSLDGKHDVLLEDEFNEDEMPNRFWASNNGRYCIVSSDFRNDLWDIETGNKLYTFTGYYFGFFIDDDGTKIIGIDEKGNISKYIKYCGNPIKSFYSDCWAEEFNYDGESFIGTDPHHSKYYRFSLKEANKIISEFCEIGEYHATDYEYNEKDGSKCFYNHDKSAYAIVKDASDEINIFKNNKTYKLKGFNYEIAYISFSPDCEKIVITTEYDTSVYDIESSVLIESFPYTMGPYASSAFDINYNIHFCKDGVYLFQYNFMSVMDFVNMIKNDVLNKKK